MVDKDTVLNIIYRAIESLNSELDASRKITPSPETELFGPNSGVDSLGLVSLIVDVEALVADELDRHISLADDKAMSRAISPFSSVDTLADYIIETIRAAD